jgi:hypothetical protein
MILRLHAAVVYQNYRQYGSPWDTVRVWGFTEALPYSAVV